MIQFEWDELKNKQNRIKHGIWFEEAQTIFDDPRARYFIDLQHSTKEDRFLATGISSAMRLLVVVHCFKKSDSIIRIISARKATKKEAKFYEKRI